MMMINKQINIIIIIIIITIMADTNIACYVYCSVAALLASYVASTEKDKKLSVYC